MTSMSASFTGAIPENYDKYLGPAWFDEFAQDIAGRLPARPQHGAVLELACGTGIVTRRLRERLAPGVKLVATDLSKAMLDYARAKLAAEKEIEWREADATKLPFGDAEFGAVVCSFGVMFVPDRPAAFREARRVLKEGGTFLFNVWDRIEEVPHSNAAAKTFAELFPGDAEMQFSAPFDMHDAESLRRLLADARFREVRIERRKVDVVATARGIATGQIRGTPRSLLIEKRGVSLEDAIARMEQALAKVGGADPYRSYCQAVVVEARAI
jgi:ubiquinone/menaquinone biosynthesis C-methylase UbiE